MKVKFLKTFTSKMFLRTIFRHIEHLVIIISSKINEKLESKDNKLTGNTTCITFRSFILLLYLSFKNVEIIGILSDYQR